MTSNVMTVSRGLTMVMSAATAVRALARRATVFSAGGFSALTSNVYQMYSWVGERNVMDPVKLPPRGIITDSSYSASLSASTVSSSLPLTPCMSHSTRYVIALPLSTLRTEMACLVRHRALQSITMWSSATGSSPTPCSLYWYVSPIVAFRRIRSPSTEHIQLGENVRLYDARPGPASVLGGTTRSLLPVKCCPCRSAWMLQGCSE
mmetsp:Transcript_40339/g.100903  ORF Transcript_40339/g.100903 Transcript_40339/m.100903 type:complete len:206 (-) Transcript_40339:756-1373(-)